MDRWKRLSLKLLAWLAFGIAAFMFAALLRSQRATFETDEERRTMVAEKRGMELREWLLDFAICDQPTTPFDECRRLERAESAEAVELPSAELGRIIAAFPEAPTRVLANHVITPEEREWLSARGIAALVMPRASLNSVVLHTSRRAEVAFGHGSSVVLPVYVANLQEAPTITLEFDMRDLGFFGPMDLPIVLAEPDEAAKYQSIPVRQFAANALTRQLQIGVPVIFAALAIVLDHSLVFSLLALQAVAMSCRSYLSYLIETGSGGFWTWNGLYLMNGLTAAFLVLLVAEIAGVAWRGRWMRPAAVAGAVALALAGQWIDPIYTLRVDAWSDSLACAVSLVVLGFAVRGLTRPGLPATEGPSFFALSSIFLYTRLLILTAGLGIHLSVNLRDLWSLGGSDFLRQYNDWQHSALFLALVVASLLEVGSTAKRMQRAAKELAEKAVIEQELEVGRDFQRHMLPGRKGSSVALRWRALYFPASALAGDWFDIREIRFGDGSTFTVAVVADVTGHGVGASLSTSVLSCLWGLWCNEAQRLSAPANREECERMVQKIAFSLNAGLLAMRRNEGATAIFLLIPPSAEYFCVCSAGHPGAMVARTDGLQYVATPGKKLGSGAAEESDWVAKSVDFPADATLVLTTDGLIPAGKSASSFAKQIDRDTKSRKVRAEVLLVQALAEVRRLFRRDADVRDDVTVVLFRRDHEESVAIGSVVNG